MIAIWSKEEPSRESVLLAKRLGIPLVEVGQEIASTAKFVFFYSEGALYLQSFTEKGLKPFCIDYASDSFFRRVRKSSSDDLLLKACGAKKGNLSLLDASFGLGYDGVFLSAHNFLITACERNEYLYEFSIDALVRLKEEGGYSAQPPHIFLGDTRDFLRQYPEQFDVIYLDPMYPDTGKSALAKKEMRVFRELLGGDTDSAELFQFVLGFARDRVVVKRADDAEPIVSEAIRKVDISYTGKSVRFDVYLLGR